MFSDGRSRNTSGGIEKRKKYLDNVKHLVVDGNPKPDKMYLFEKLQQSQTKLQAEGRPNKHMDYKDSSRTDRRTTEDSVDSDYSISKSSSRTRRDSDGMRTGSRQTSKNGECLVII